MVLGASNRKLSVSCDNIPNDPEFPGQMFPIARPVPVAAGLVSEKRQRKHSGVTVLTGGGQELDDSEELNQEVFPTRSRDPLLLQQISHNSV